MLVSLRIMQFRATPIIVLLTLLVATVAQAEAAAAAPAGPGGAPGAPASDAEALAKQVANPVANLISVPIQMNFDYGIGPENGARFLTNIQPVIPFSLGKNWNVITRTIMPVTYQTDIFPGAGDQFGLGDINASQFFSPKKPTRGGLIWGAGPIWLLPTGTNDLLGGDKWGAGPTIVVLKQKGPVTVGLLANHIWSFAGDHDRPDVSATFLQPFYSHTTKTAFSLTFNTESSYDWKNEQWTVPLIIQASQVTHVSGQLMSLQLGFKWYVEKPDSAPEWGVRFQVSLLFPR